MAGELADVEGVAVGAVVDPARIRGSVEQRRHLVDGEALDRHPLDLAVAPQVRDRTQQRRSDRVGVAVRAQHEQAFPGGAARDPRQEAERVPVGQVQVVEHEHERPRGRGRRQPRLDLRPVGRPAADGLRERLVRDERLLLARAVEDRRARRARLGGEAGGEARLADPRLAGEQHDLRRPAAGCDTSPGGADSGELLLRPTNVARSARSSRPGNATRGATEAPRRSESASACVSADGAVFRRVSSRLRSSPYSASAAPRSPAASRRRISER